MIINEINSYLVKYKKEITTTGVGVIQTLGSIKKNHKRQRDEILD